MDELEIVDDYLFYQKEYRQRDRSFTGVSKPKALWRMVWGSEGSYEATKSECKRAYGFYYTKVTNIKL